MDKLTKWLEEKFLPVAGKVAGWRYMVAARNSFFSSIPFILVGSVFLIVAFARIPGYETWVQPYVGKLVNPFNMTMGLLSIWIALSYGYSLAQQYGLNPLVGGMSSLMGFFIIAAPLVEGNLSGAYLGGTGIFAALLVATFSVEVYRFFITRNIVIKLPDSVPPMIGASFSAILPLLAQVLVLDIIANWFKWDIPGLIMKAFVPLVTAGDSFIAVVFLAFLVALLFYMGIHGWAVVLGVVGPIELANIEANAAAHAAGLPMPHVLTEPFFAAWGSIGGTTTAAALVIWLLFAKSKQLKQVGRLAAVPSLLVNVHEPAMFGVPTVLNPYFFFPVVFTYPILAAITWIAMNIGWVTKPFIYVPWSTPEPFYPWLATGGDWRAVVLMFFNLAIALLIYYPFVRAYDRMLVKRESGGVSADAAGQVGASVTAD